MTASSTSRTCLDDVCFSFYSQLRNPQRGAAGRADRRRRAGCTCPGHRQRRLESTARRGHPLRPERPPSSGPTNQEVGAAFIRADANKDGKLSRQEAVRFPAVEQRFDQIDTNKDQFVSREEFEIALKS
jgi:hypothetical protein